MTTPLIFSNLGGETQQAKVLVGRGVTSQEAYVTIPSATPAATIIGMVPFKKGFTLTGLAIKSDDLDTATNVTLSVGYVYIDGSTGVDDDDAIILGSTLPQTGSSLVWPTAGGLLTGVSFTAVDDGYLSIIIGGAPTTTTGQVRLIAQFTYDIK